MERDEIEDLAKLIPSADRGEEEGSSSELIELEDEELSAELQTSSEYRDVIGFHSLIKQAINARTIPEMVNSQTKIPELPHEDPMIQQLVKALKKIDQNNPAAVNAVLKALSTQLRLTTSVETSMNVLAYEIGERARMNPEMIAQRVLDHQRTLQQLMPVAMRAADLDPVNRCTLISDGDLIRLVTPIDRSRRRLPDATVSGWFWAGDPFNDEQIRPFLLLSAQKLRPIMKRTLLSGQ